MCCLDWCNSIVVFCTCNSLCKNGTVGAESFEQLANQGIPANMLIDVRGIVNSWDEGCRGPSQDKILYVYSTDTKQSNFFTSTRGTI